MSVGKVEYKVEKYRRNEAGDLVLIDTLISEHDLTEYDVKAIEGSENAAGEHGQECNSRPDNRTEHKNRV